MDGGKEEKIEKGYKVVCYSLKPLEKIGNKSFGHCVSFFFIIHDSKIRCISQSECL